MNSDKSGSGLSRFDFAEKADVQNVMNTCSTGNLLAPKRLVVIKRLIVDGTVEDQKRLLSYLGDNKGIVDDNDLVVVFWEESLPKKSNALFKFLEKNSKKQNYEKMTGAKLSQWIIKKIKNNGSSISRAALDRLTAYAGDDIYLLDQEIEKLLSYSGEKMINDKSVELLVRANLSSNIFQTIDALAENDKNQAMELLHRHIKNGDDPFYIFSMFVYQFRNLLKISGLKNEGISNEYEISKITGMHPFVIKKSANQIRRFSFMRLKEIYQNLADLDLGIKTGKIDIKLALDKFVAEL